MCEGYEECGFLANLGCGDEALQRLMAVKSATKSRGRRAIEVGLEGGQSLLNTAELSSTLSKSFDVTKAPLFGHIDTGSIRSPLSYRVRSGLGRMLQNINSILWVPPNTVADAKMDTTEQRRDGHTDINVKSRSPSRPLMAQTRSTAYRLSSYARAHDYNEPNAGTESARYTDKWRNQHLRLVLDEITESDVSTGIAASSLRLRVAISPSYDMYSSSSQATAQPETYVSCLTHRRTQLV